MGKYRKRTLGHIYHLDYIHMVLNIVNIKRPDEANVQKPIDIGLKLVNCVVVNKIN